MDFLKKARRVLQEIEEKKMTPITEDSHLRPCTPSPDRQDQAPTAKSSRTETMRADDKTVGRRPLPFLDKDGSLVIPFASDPRYHWWAGGQTVRETEREVRGWLN